MKNVQQAHLAASTEQRDHGEDRSTVAEERVGVLGVPNELLDIILGYAPDLETRFAAVQTSHQFCESIERLSPRLEHQLVRKRFPLLAALDAGGSTQRPTEPRDLFITYSRFFDEEILNVEGNLPGPEPTVALDSYTLALELEVIGPPPTFTKKSVFVGTGILPYLDLDAAQTSACIYEFAVPRGLFSTLDERLASGEVRDIRAKIVATRSIDGYVQHAKLYDGRLENGESNVFHFEYDDLPNTGCSAALRWYEIAAAVTPGCSVTWRREWDSQDQANALQSVVHARLSWCNAATDEVVSMSCADAKLAFEHYVDWPSSLAELSLKIGALPRSDTLTAKDFEERIVKFVLDAFPESFRDRAPPRVRRDVAD